MSNKVARLAEDLGFKHQPPNNIQPGDLYLAYKNTSAKILTCKRKEKTFIVPEEFGEYCYDLSDCVKIVGEK